MEILETKIILSKSNTKVVARVDVVFDWFRLNGFKIIRDPNKGNKEYVTPPSYESPDGWRGVFETTNKPDWWRICDRVLHDYDEKIMKEVADATKEKP